jgi:predicted lipoprotein
MKRRLSWFSCLLIGLLAACTIVPIEEMEQLQQSETFDPVTYVDGIWESQVVPAIVEKAQELPAVLAAIQTNLTQAGEQYATISQSGALNFVVKGQGTVAAVDTESRNGTAVLEIDGYDGPVVIVMQIGPLVRGDGVRDGVGFIEFGDFKEQTEFGQVSKELNQRVADNVLSGLDLNALVGKQVSFDGVFTIRTTNQTNIDLSEVVITPVVLNVEG